MAFNYYLHFLFTFVTFPCQIQTLYDLLYLAIPRKSVDRKITIL